MTPKKAPSPVPSSDPADALSPAAAERAQTRSAISSSLRSVAAFVEAHPEHPSAPALAGVLVKAHAALVDADSRSEQDERIERVGQPLLQQLVHVVEIEMRRMFNGAAERKTEAGAKAAA